MGVQEVKEPLYVHDGRCNSVNSVFQGSPSRQLQFLLDLERQIELAKFHIRAAGLLHDEEATLQL